MATAGNDVIVATKGALIECMDVRGRYAYAFPFEEEAARLNPSAIFQDAGAGASRAERRTLRRFSLQTGIGASGLPRDGKLMWNVKEPGGYRTAHQPRPMDIDRDEIAEGIFRYAMLNADGSVAGSLRRTR
jgi:hypothetical protein